jgi:ATP phosphoribosyltransferase regulatory subunit
VVAERYPGESMNAARWIEDLDRQSTIIMALFARAGFEPVAPPVLQPADVMLDLVGEDLRARTYVFTDPDGAELCLRNDLTIPTCRLYVARHREASAPARYAYNGEVFRYQSTADSAARPREFRQIGIESFAAPVAARAEAEALALCAESVRAAGIRAPRIQVGDLGLFRALIAAIDMPERWRQRLLHHFWKPASFHRQIEKLIDPASHTHGLPSDLLAEVAASSPEAAIARVQAWLDGRGAAVVGTRTLEEVVEQVRTIAADLAAPRLPVWAAQLIESYLSIRAPAVDATRSIRALIGPHGLDIGPALQAFDARLDLIAEEGIDTSQLAFAAGFGRGFEYYTGFVFEFTSPVLGDDLPLGGGGRYDTLVQAISGGDPVPAVGAALHCERLLLAAQGRGPDRTTAPVGINGSRRASGDLVLAIPSKGRLMDETLALFARGGLTLARSGDARGYRGHIAELAGVEIAFVSSSEIAQLLRSGEAHLGVTGEDLIRETIGATDETVELIAELGYGHADVVVAVPAFWIDVASVADLEEAAVLYRRRHGSRMRVATKYTNLTRRFFAGQRWQTSARIADVVTLYRVVESLGATEGAPAAGTAELIVDITSTGSTLKANGLSVLEDGVILRSQANLVASKTADWSAAQRALRATIETRLGLRR